ncbi:hypothetical protein MA16_Dca006026 [Dendrobium catenatum]|uniref:Uncharacterized protein n=1 Tax=Dendrobium catenatum TaxID=906689 RepID=A0A2I0WJZ6_9ASPA|nr:hypothetical protein MA16_Dca006026 [Dendrobium catenatum]
MEAKEGGDEDGIREVKSQKEEDHQSSLPHPTASNIPNDGKPDEQIKKREERVAEKPSDILVFSRIVDRVDCSLE